MIARGSRRAMTAVGIGAVLAALATTALTSRFEPRTWEYSEIAASILAGRGLQYEYLQGTVYRFYGPPLYPLLLALVKYLTGTEWMTLIVQAGLFSGTALLIYALTRDLFGPLPAAVAGAAAATHPGSLFFAGQLHAQTLDVFSIALAFVLLLTMTPETRATGALVTGVGAGAAALCRGPFLPFLAAWGVWFLWRHRGRREAWSRMLVVAFGVLVTLAPVVVRGYSLYGTLVPLRTDTGMNLWYGNHPGATGTSHTLSIPPEPITVHLSSELRARLAGANELQQHRILSAAALEFVRTEPWQVMALFVKKLGYFWWFSPHAGLSYPPWWLHAYVPYYIAVVLTALVGLVVALRSPRTRDAAELFLLMAAVLAMAQAVFYVEGRHRWEIEPLMLIFSAVGIVACARALVTRFSVIRDRADDSAMVTR